MNLDKLRKVTAKAKAGTSKPPAQELVPMDDLKFKQWMDGQELMQEFHISKRTLQNWRRKQLIPFTRIGNKFLYDRTLIEEMLQDSCVIPKGVKQKR